MKRAVNMWKLYLPELYQMLVIMLIGEIFGIVLVKIIVSFDSTVKGYAVFGPVIALCLGMFITLVAMAFSYGAKFNLAVSMGCTRKDFFYAYWVGMILFTFIEMAAVLIFGLFETGLGRIMYANTFLFEEFNILPYIMDYRVIIALLLLVPAIGIFVGSFVMKFQMKAFWVLWAGWMIAFLGGAKVSSIISENPNSVLANIVKDILHFFQTISGPVWILLFMAVCAVMLIVSSMLMRKQEVI